MNPKLVKYLKAILPLSLGVFLIYYSINSATPEERERTYQYIINADLFWILLSVSMGVLSHFIRAYRWQFLLEPLNYSIKLSNSYMAIMAGYLANLGIPRSGEVLRGATIASYEKTSFEKVFGTIVTERVIDLLMLLIVIIITLVFQFDLLMSFFNDKIASPFISFAILIALIFVGVLGLKILKKSNHPFIKKVYLFGQGILEGIRSISLMKKKNTFIICTILIWILYVGMFYAVKFSIPETSTLTISAILVAFIAGSIAMSTTNGGIGVFPIAIASALVLFGIEKQAGEAFGWVIWGSQTAINILLGALSFILLPVLNREK